MLREQLSGNSSFFMEREDYMHAEQVMKTMVNAKLKSSSSLQIVAMIPLL